jgi:hypothetical protein
MLHPDPNPIPGPECIPVPLPPGQKVAVPVLKHCLWIRIIVKSRIRIRIKVISSILMRVRNTG